MNLSMALVNHPTGNWNQLQATFDAAARNLALQLMREYWSTQPDDTLLIELQDAVPNGQGNYVILIPAERADEFADLMGNRPELSNAQNYIVTHRSSWTPPKPTESEPE